MQGMFADAELFSRTPLPLIPQCGKCQLYRKCRSPKMKVWGEGRRKIMVVGEAPGEEEDKHGRPFVGPAGQKLRTTLRKFDVDLDKDCWVVNAARCHPKKNDLPERAIEYCRPLTVRDIEELQPEIIVLLGASAVKSVIGWLWKETVGEIGKWIGWQIPHQRLNAWLCPTWHPSFVKRETDKDNANPVIPMMFERHLQAAFELKGRPWKKVPDYDPKCLTIIDPVVAGNWIAGMPREPVAFDFETNMLKPDSDRARIICCSVSNGRVSMAFPWIQPAIKAAAFLFESDIPKVGWNVKFEDRWCRRFGIRVKNWIHDGMIATHLLDCRTGVSGLKFAAFVGLGVEELSHDIKPYLESKDNSGGGENRITEIPLPKLLFYCAKDSLLEYKMYQLQTRQLEVTDESERE